MALRWSLRQDGAPLSVFKSPADIRQTPFGLNKDTSTEMRNDTENEKFDIILFCHSMYGMKPKANFVQRALGMLVERPEGGMVVVFHRDGTLRLDNLVCHQTASFPDGVVRVANNDETLENLILCFHSGLFHAG